MELFGKIIEVMPVQRGESKNGKWVKNEFVIETQTNYPKKICLSYWKDDVPLQLGSLINVKCDIESKEFNGRWYTEIRAWAIDFQAPIIKTTNPQPQEMPKIDLEPETGDDLPFN